MASSFRLGSRVATLLKPEFWRECGRSLTGRGLGRAHPGPLTPYGSRVVGSYGLNLGFVNVRHACFLNLTLDY